MPKIPASVVKKRFLYFEKERSVRVTSGRGAVDVHDELSRPKVGEDRENHDTDDSSVAGGSARRRRPCRSGRVFLVDSDNSEGPERRVGGLKGGTGEGNHVNRRVVLRDFEDEDEELLRQRDTTTHTGVGDDGEDGEDGEDDGARPVLDHPEVNGVGDRHRDGKNEGDFEDGFGEEADEDEEDGGEDEGGTTDDGEEVCRREW